MSVIQTEKPKNILTFSFLSSVSAFIATCIVFPIDKINVRAKVHSQKIYNPLKIVKNLFLNEGIRGAYRGISMTPFTTIPTFLCSGIIYQKLNMTWKNNETLNKSFLFALSPIINIFLSGIITNAINTPGYILIANIHSQSISVQEAIKRLRQKNIHSFIEIYKISYFSIALFLSVRQQLYEHLMKIFRIQYKISEKKSILLTTVLSAVLANVVYQPFQIIMTRYAINKSNKTSILNILDQMKKSQKSLIKVLYRGFQFRIFSSGIFNMIYLPIYGILKQEYDLYTYI